MDEAEENKSFVDKFAAKLLPTLALDDVDGATKQSLVVTELLDAFGNEYKSVAFDCWFAEVMGWMAMKSMEFEIPESSMKVKRDDRVIEVALHATYKSFVLVMEQLRQPTARLYFRAKRTIKSICRRILASFDLLCKNFLIANTCDAINLRSNILKAADLANDYIRVHKDQIQFSEDGIDSYDEFILCILQGNLTGNFSVPDDTSNMQFATKALDDDLVGLGDDLIKIKERLTGSQSKLDIIPIVGMGGIGKTTLTKRVYQDPQIMLHFHVRAWIIASQEFRERDVLLGLLHSIAPMPDEVYKEDKEQLAERLYRRLKGWRYLIVIDDIWTTEAWDHLKLCFPDDDNGSRILLTSRITKVAYHVNPEIPPHFMNFLGLDDSWELLCKQVYGKKACPPDLVNVGMQIVEKCQGLPLAIKVVAGHLSNISKTPESWEDVAKKVGLPTEVSQIESLLNILSMSYNDLPHHLKACFLSLVTFPKNSEIPVRKLIRLWTAMGFLPTKVPDGVENVAMEEVAMKCFEDLISRNLIMVKKRKFDGKIKLCGIHDLLWDLSMREARKEGSCIFGDNSLCHSYINTGDGVKYVMGLTRTLLYFDQSFESHCPLNSEGFKLLRVLDILNQCFDHFPIEIIGLVNLRYLALATSGNIPGSVSELCNLETLINSHERAGPMLPKEVWLLARLRHLHIGTCIYLVEPTFIAFEGSSVSLLPDLQTLSNLSTANCTEEVFSKIQSLKELGICETGEEDIEDELLFSSLNNLVYLHQLEVLKLCCKLELERPRRIPHWNSFLPNIKHLTLIHTNLEWSEMNALAMLPKLEILKLKKNAFSGDEWQMEDEEFLQLKYLLLESLDLILWKANQDHFPNLQCLVIRSCAGLAGIPTVIGEVSTLQLIDLEYCSPVLIDLVRRIQRAQMDVGNDQLIVRIGHTVPELQLFGLVPAFAYMALRLKMPSSKKGRRKKKRKDIQRKSEVLAGDFVSCSSLAGANDE